LWTEEQTATVSLGEFSVVLGNGISASGLAGGTASATPATEANNRGDLSAVFTSGDSRYLEIALDNGDGQIQTTDVAISPRQQITSTGYAFHAKVADGIASSTDLSLSPLSGTASNYGLGWYGTGRTFNTIAVDGPVLYGNSGGALGSNVNGTQKIALNWNASGQVGFGATSSFDSSNKLTIQGDDASTPGRQLVIRGDSNPTERLNIGFDTNLNQATLQSYVAASTAGNLQLNPSGGNVGIGKSAAPTVALDVTGAVTATGAVTGGSLNTAGTVTATGAVTGGSLVTGGTVTATGAVTGGSLNTSGAVTAASHVGNGAALTSLTGTNITTGSVPLAALVAAVQQALCPAGTVVAYMGTTAPTTGGWLLCDGSLKVRADYPALFAVLGTKCGYLTSNDFYLPDFRGRFLRGWDSAIGRDPDRASRNAMAAGGNTGDAIGSIQGDAFKNHTHAFSDTYTNFSQTSASGGAGNTGATGTLVQDDTTLYAGGSETRPMNAYVNYIIKF
ncbi:MAG: tail fiber protein, partial [Akkermansiaceae bacterium]|nr:tail fiber protein [Akkermansiaceae bacterium]